MTEKELQLKQQTKHLKEVVIFLILVIGYLFYNNVLNRFDDCYNYKNRFGNDVERCYRDYKIVPHQEPLDGPY